MPVTRSAAVDAVSFTVATTRLITLRLRGRGFGAGLGAGRFAAAFFAGAFLAGAFLADAFFEGDAFFEAAFLAGAFLAALFFPPARRAEVFFAAFFVVFFEEDLPEDFFEDFLAAMRFLLLRTLRVGVRGNRVARGNLDQHVANVTRALADLRGRGGLHRHGARVRLPGRSEPPPDARAGQPFVARADDFPLRRARAAGARRGALRRRLAGHAAGVARLAAAVRAERVPGRRGREVPPSSRHRSDRHGARAPHKLARAPPHARRPHHRAADRQG